MTNLTPERVKRAREWVENYMPEASELRDTILSALAILDDYSKVKAENEGLRLEQTCLKNDKLALLMEFKDQRSIAQKLVLKIEEMKRELDAARPLIKAVMGADLPYEGRTQFGSHFMWETDETRILDAALALRKSKGEKK